MSTISVTGAGAERCAADNTGIAEDDGGDDGDDDDLLLLLLLLLLLMYIGLGQ